MPRVSSQSTIRNTITLSDDEWQTVLSLMTGPCTISQMVKAGIERHTAEIVRVKILSAIVQEQQQTMLKWYSKLSRISRKGPKQRI